MLHIALYEPRMPQNTGNLIRLVSNNGFHLHLIEPLGFTLDEKKLRRASLDYRDMARVTVHPNYAEFREHMLGKRIFAITTKGKHFYHETKFREDDVLLFGSETSGLPDHVRDSLESEHKIRVPMLPESRSMNLSNAVAVVSFEAWRQLGFNNGI